MPSAIMVNAKSNEITAVPRLLELLRIQGCIVTLDAMGMSDRNCGRHYVLGKTNDDMTG